MTTQQLKKAVVEALDNIPDDVLAELLAYLQALQGKDDMAIQRARHLRTILHDDSALLKALAK